MAAERCFDETFVAPQWLPGGQAFWYRRKTDEKKFKFVLVDIPQKTVRPAFDHEQLSGALRKHSGIRVDPKLLPFSWIELENSLVRFRFQEQIWQYEPGKCLVQWPGEFSQGNRTLMRRQEPSASNFASQHASVSFVNATRSPLNLFQVDEEGVKDFFMPLSVGKVYSQKTFAGIFWRIEDAVSGQLRGVYCVPDVGHSTVSVGEVDVDEYLGEEDSLPQGWTQQRDHSGRIYYVDHNTKTTRWEHPNTLGHEVALDATNATPGNQPVDDDGVDQEPRVEQRDDDDNRPTKNYGSQLDIGDLQVFVHDGSLWLKDNKKIETKLSDTDSKGSYYARETLYASPDKKFLIAWQYTAPTETSEFRIDYNPDGESHSKLIETTSTLLGDSPGFVRPQLFDLASKRKIKTSDSFFLDQYELHHLGWSHDSSEYRLIFDGRGHQVLKILGINRTGSIRVLHKEESKTFIDVISKMYFSLLSKSDKLLWASESDGYNHLYLIDLHEGRLQYQVTKGHWNVHMVESIDEDEEYVWMSAYGFHKDQDPYHIHLIRARFDGSETRALTDGDGTHSWSWPLDTRQHFVDTWSRVDLPPQTIVRCAKTGISLLEVEAVSIKSLKRRGWVPPERFQCLGRDGKTPIYGIIIKPSNFGKMKAQNYPVIEDIYAGPYDFFTPKSFGQVLYSQTWSSYGYITVQIDGMGTNWRSKKFHDICYKNLQDAGFPDRIIWIKEAAKARPWMDISRLGIIGTSEGGANAAAALIHHGHFYKVAVSIAGAHDQTHSRLWWSEQWFGFPAEKAALENSNTTHAGKLPDDTKMMLIAGGLDHACNPSSVMRFIQELNKAKKMYEFVFIPDGGHDCGEDPYVLMRIKAFLKTNLAHREASKYGLYAI